jgi:signal transduction histidine kinase
MIRTRSIEQRVMRSLTGLAVVVTVLCGGMALLIAYITEDEIIDRLLAIEVEHLQHSYAVNSVLPTPRVDYMRLYARLEQAPSAVINALIEHPRSREIFTRDERHFHVRYLYFSEIDQPILVAEVSPLLVVTTMSSGLLRLLLCVLVLMIGIAIWLAYRIARQTTRPIMQLSNEVKQRRHSHESLSLRAAGRDDEVGYLADTIEATFNELQEALHRERHFTRDVSHELRTPLTIMNNVLSLISNRQITANDMLELQQSVDHMQATVTVLLTLARAESLQTETLRLRPLVEESILSIHTALQAENFQVALSMSDDYKVDGNPQLITLLVTNLIENAQQYAASPSLHIIADHDELCFSNDIAAPLLNDLMAPNQKQADSQGIGQGLFLVKRIADALGWQLATQIEADEFSVILTVSAVR